MYLFKMSHYDYKYIKVWIPVHLKLLFASFYRNIIKLFYYFLIVLSDKLKSLHYHRAYDHQTW